MYSERATALNAGLFAFVRAQNVIALAGLLAWATPAFARNTAPYCAGLLVPDRIVVEGLKPAAARLVRTHFETFAQQIRDFLGPHELPLMTFKPTVRPRGQMDDYVTEESRTIVTTLPARMVERARFGPAFVRAAHEVGHVVLTHAIRQRYAGDQLVAMRELEAQYQEFFADLFSGLFHGDWNVVGRGAEPDQPVRVRRAHMRRCDFEILHHAACIYEEWYTSDRDNLIRYYMFQPAKNAIQKGAVDLAGLSPSARRRLMENLLEATIDALVESTAKERFDVEDQNAVLIRHLRARGVIR